MAPISMNANGLVYNVPGSETTSSVGLFTWPTGIPGFLAVLGLLLAVSLVLGLTIWYTVRAVKAVFKWSSATITRSRKLKPLLLPMYVADQGHQANRDVFESHPVSPTSSPLERELKAQLPADIADEICRLTFVDGQPVTIPWRKYTPSFPGSPSTSPTPSLADTCSTLDSPALSSEADADCSPSQSPVSLAFALATSTPEAEDLEADIADALHHVAIPATVISHFPPETIFHGQSVLKLEVG